MTVPAEASGPPPPPGRRRRYRGFPSGPGRPAPVPGSRSRGTPSRTARPGGNQSDHACNASDQCGKCGNKSLFHHFSLKKKCIFKSKIHLHEYLRFVTTQILPNHKVCKGKRDTQCRTAYLFFAIQFVWYFHYITADSKIQPLVKILFRNMP